MQCTRLSNNAVFMQLIEIKKNSRVRWYVFALGTEVDLHTPHWHGNNVYVHGQREDVVNLLPATQACSVACL